MDDLNDFEYVLDDDIDHMRALGLTISSIDGLFYHQRGIEGAAVFVPPILVLVHGYPQTNFMWRNIIPLLPKEIPLFIPDMPGYGRSLALDTGSAKGNAVVGDKIIDTLAEVLGQIGYETNEIPVIIAGHDRGARLCHRLAVDATRKERKLDIKGAMFLDIVPTLTQFQSFSTPSAAVGTFHWPFLANTELAFDMIKVYGGAKWAQMCISRWAGKDKTSLASLKANDAIKVYSTFFEKDSVIRASCRDYQAGADQDVRLQEADQKSNKKIDIDILVLSSSDYLGARYDVKKVWQEWMGTGSLEVQHFEGGHFLAEEKPEETAAAIMQFYRRFPWVDN